MIYSTGKYTNKNKKIFYYSKNFLSFSKDKKVAKKFLNNYNNNNAETVIFKLVKSKNEKYFLSNIDIHIQRLSNFKDEKDEQEVLILPLTCFEVVRIGKKKNLWEYFI